MKTNKINLVFLIPLFFVQITCIQSNNLRTNSLTSFLKLLTGIKLKEEQTLSPDTNITIVAGICNINNCRTPQGECVNFNACKCNKAYSDKEKFYATENNLRCAYELKSQTTSFLLEFFLIFGAGHFYSKRYLYGLLKALFIIFVISIDICLRSKMKYERNKIFNAFMYSAYFLVLLCQIFDLVMFGMNKFRDGNNFPLY